MEKQLYMVMIEKTKTYNRITKQIVTEHVENIRQLDDCLLYTSDAADEQ